jgi:hypothetical protein
VRGLKVQKHVHKPVDVSDSHQQRHHCLRYPRDLAGPRKTHRHDSRVQLLGPYATEVGGGTGFLIKQDVMAALRSCVGGQKFDQATWVRLKSKSRQNLCLSAYVRPISPTRSQAEFADDLSALTVDIEHWQQKNTVVVCGDFNARIGRQGAESPTNSVVPQFERSRGTSGATLVDLMNTTGCSLANRKAPRPDTRASALRGSR